jgi:hypothetical protein
MKSLPEILADVYIAAYQSSMDRYGPQLDANLRSAHILDLDVVNPETSRGSARKVVHHFMQTLREIPEVDLNKIPTELEDNPDAGKF